MYYAKKLWGPSGGGGVVLNFVPFVAPESFDHPNKYTDFGLNVNLYEKLKIYKMTWAGADIAVEFSDEIASVNLSLLQMPVSSAIEVFETILGVETSVLYTTTGQHIFTEGSTKRYMIRRVTTAFGFLLPVGSIWAYGFGILALTMEPSTSIKYIFLDENILIDTYFQDTTIEGTLRINGGITTIAAQSFSNCTNLTKLIIGDSVTTIDGANASGAFQQCTSLLIVDLGTGLTSIGTDTFNGCTSLVSIICRAYNPPTLWTNAFNGIPTTTNFYVPHERVDAYKMAAGWQNLHHVFIQLMTYKKLKWHEFIRGNYRRIIYYI